MICRIRASGRTRRIGVLPCDWLGCSDVTRKERGDAAQMTVELCIVFPVAIILALIAVNALTFFGDCAEFDRIARNSARVHATALAHGESATDVVAAIMGDLSAAFPEENLEAEVESCSSGDGLTTYRMTLEYYPTLFGLGLRTEILGVPLPKLTHMSSLTVSPYRPGMLF